VVQTNKLNLFYFNIWASCVFWVDYFYRLSI